MKLLGLWTMSKPFRITVHIALFAVCPLMHKVALKMDSHTQGTNTLPGEPYVNPGKKINKGF